MPDAVTIRASAKINLALAVDRPIETGPHAGMHPIASWMAPIDLADTVTIERTGPGDGSRFEIRWADGRPVEWPRASDLGVRAHALLEREAGPLGVRVTVEKRIPAGGGLGGGSADAGAVLRGVNALFGLGFPTDRLRALATELGSDVPFFIPEGPGPGEPPATGLGTGPSTGLVTGLGNQIERLLSPSLGPGPVPLLLIVPPYGCPTGEVYRAFDGAPPQVFRETEVAEMARASEIDPADLFNDLARPAAMVRPELGDVRARLARSLGRPVHVSGSGSTLFCIGPGIDGCVGTAREFLPDTYALIRSSVLS